MRAFEKKIEIDKNGYMVERQGLGYDVMLWIGRIFMTLLILAFMISCLIFVELLARSPIYG